MITASELRTQTSAFHTGDMSLLSRIETYLRQLIQVDERINTLTMTFDMQNSYFKLQSAQFSHDGTIAMIKPDLPSQSQLFTRTELFNAITALRDNGFTVDNQSESYVSPVSHKRVTYRLITVTF